MRVDNKFSYTIFLLIISTFLYGAEIKFIAPDYAGDAFSFYVVPNFLTEKQEIVGSGEVDKTGTFSCKIDISEQLPVYAEFDVYKGWLVLNPNETIEITLPPKEQKTSSNPFFKPRMVHLGIKNPAANNINLLIVNFNRQFQMQMSQNMQEIFYRRSIETAEKVVSDLQSQFSETNNIYFEHYKTYKYASIKHTAQIQDPNNVINEYFIKNPILYNQPEYSEMFDKLFTKYLQYATQQVNGQKISVLLNSGAFEQLIDWLTIDMKFDKPLAESIILKGVKPLFYSKRFNTVGLFNILHKITETSTIEIHRISANKIFNELARTQYGTIAPELDLVDINGNFVEWENFKGKYVYLCFSRTDNEKFASHKMLMKEFQIKFKDDLAIVVVIENENDEQNAGLLENKDFQWTVLRGTTRREIYESYNVRILPTYFLVDPQGRMAGSQAPWPDENFEMQFANVLKATKN
ncbi:MAG TPA: redoxin domain-containing protein [Prolixibacteraceae bacterium]|nr:redoxin domain-containing protein [Prolixibacteraceae bacterium]